MTHCLLHVSHLHLYFNALSFQDLSTVEETLTSQVYLAFIVFLSLSSGAFHLLLSKLSVLTTPTTNSVGFSAVVFGIWSFRNSFRLEFVERMSYKLGFL